MIGLLVIAGNHFIVRGPEPSLEVAQQLARRWSIIQIGSGINATETYQQWRVSTREFRENLTWAIVLEQPPSPAVSVLLAELAARQVPIRQLSGVN